MTEHLKAILAAAIRRGNEPQPMLRAENQTRAYFELFAHLPLRERQARSFAYALVNEPVRVFPAERVHGMFYQGPDPQYAHPDWGEHCVGHAAARRQAEEVPEFAPFIQCPGDDARHAFIISDGGLPGHVAWNYDLILSLGVEGLMARHREALSRATDPEARAYYEAVLICLDAVLEWNARHVAELRRLLADSVEPDERARLEESIRVMERVPAKPARTFHEAIQSFFFQWQCVMYEAPYGGNGPGRLDYFLWPYLERDTLSCQEAAALVAELFIKIDERAHLSDGHVNTIVVGGVKPDGTDGVNPLSTMMLDVFEALQISHPAVYTRIGDTSPPAYVDRCVEYMLNGNNRAQILVDEPIIRAMMREARMQFEDAAMYMCGGCMEISPHGMNSDLLFAFYYNLPKTLELLITGGECLITAHPRIPMACSLRDFDTFDGFYEAFGREVRRVLHAKFRCLDIWSEEMARCRPTFLLSSMTADCLERGRGQQDGGARYADYGGSPLGIQNAADSLFAIKTAVFDDAFCSADELIDALRRNFHGYEALHRRLLAVPKYGVGDSGADGMMDRVLTTVCSTFDAYTNRHGGRCKPVVLTFVWAPVLGRDLGASPDGRRAGQPIAHGLTPQSAAMRNGLTAAINSYTSISNDLVSGGASTMWDMDPEWIDSGLLRAILRAFARQGGQIFQGNTTSVEELRKAMDAPEAYPNLMVRVGGFSARFVNLDRCLQEEIVARRRHTG
ncbi:MAG: hypothetical protein JXR94_15140 [Candidatus Hydrogenedentes bacterium]|nr:hypothetical protein [Candidatus Hydrogenedentota bacterium]